jgi:hypothetical protein
LALSQKPGFWKNFWLFSERFIQKPGFLSSRKTFGSQSETGFLEKFLLARDLFRNPVSYPLEKLLALSQKPGFWKNFWLSGERFIQKPGF